MRFWPVGSGSHILHDKCIIHSPIGEHNAEGVFEDWKSIFSTIEGQLKNESWCLIEIIEATAGVTPEALEEIKLNYYKIISLGCVGIYVVSPNCAFAEGYLKKIIIETRIDHDFYSTVDKAIAQSRKKLGDG